LLCLTGVAARALTEQLVAGAILWPENAALLAARGVVFACGGATSAVPHCHIFFEGELFHALYCRHQD